MAYPATYSQSELAGSGILLKDNMNTTPGSSYRFDITNKDVTGACYLFLYTRLHNSSIPQYFNGSTITSKQNCGGEIILPYQVSIVIFKEGNSRFFLSPADLIVKDNVYISATGNIGVTISEITPP